MSLVSENIRYLRKLNGLTQEQFSRKINIKRSLLGAYEEGRANPNQQNIQAMAKAFNTTVELLTRQDLRKLRETPSLSIPLGQGSRPDAARAEPPRPNIAERSPTHPRTDPIRSDGKINATADDPFAHPDFPDIFSDTGPKTPEPKPLSEVLNKYYRPNETREPPRPAPAAPVITAPVWPNTPAVAQPMPLASPADQLFNRGVSMGSNPAQVLTFNNVYEGPTTGSRPATPVQPVAPMIGVVMQSQFGEYAQRYQQPEFVRHLPAMHLPTLPEGHYRAFEAGDEFTFPGALLVGQFIRNWFDIVDGKLYALLTRHDRNTEPGVSCWRVYNQVKAKGTLLLTADRADRSNREVALNDVLEMWEIRAFVSQQLPPPQPDTTRLRQLADELRFEIDRI